MRGPEQWDFDKRNVKGFWLCPPPPAGMQIDVKVLPEAPVYTEANLDDDMGLPDWMLAPLVSGVVGRAETKDDEHVLSGRANAMDQQFASALQAGLNDKTAGA